MFRVFAPHFAFFAFLCLGALYLPGLYFLDFFLWLALWIWSDRFLASAVWKPLRAINSATSSAENLTLRCYYPCLVSHKYMSKKHSAVIARQPIATACHNFSVTPPAIRGSPVT